MTRGFAAAEHTSRDSRAASYMAEPFSMWWALLCSTWGNEVQRRDRFQNLVEWPKQTVVWGVGEENAQDGKPLCALTLVNNLLSFGAELAWSSPHIPAGFSLALS